jgi:hypothetical protein
MGVCSSLTSAILHGSLLGSWQEKNAPGGPPRSRVSARGARASPAHGHPALPQWENHRESARDLWSCGSLAPAKPAGYTRYVRTARMVLGDIGANCQARPSAIARRAMSPAGPDPTVLSRPTRLCRFAIAGRHNSAGPNPDIDFLPASPASSHQSRWTDRWATRCVLVRRQALDQTAAYEIDRRRMEFRSPARAAGIADAVRYQGANCRPSNKLPTSWLP